MQIPKAFCLLVRAASLQFLEGLGFMTFAKTNTNLSPLLNQWKNLLQQWAKSSSLVIAFTEILINSNSNEPTHSPVIIGNTQFNLIII